MTGRDRPAVGPTDLAVRVTRWSMGKSLILLALAVGVAACGEEVDDRPASFQYIATYILAPSCGTVSCHSETTAIKGLEFDSLDGAWEAVNSGDIVPLLRGDPFQMPPDQPLPEVDIQLIERWLANGGTRN
jgi:hypothetical protein